MGAVKNSSAGQPVRASPRHFRFFQKRAFNDREGSFCLLAVEPSGARPPTAEAFHMSRHSRDDIRDERSARDVGRAREVSDFPRLPGRSKSTDGSARLPALRRCASNECRSRRHGRCVGRSLRPTSRTARLFSDRAPSGRRCASSVRQPARAGEPVINHPDLAIHPRPPAADQRPRLETVIARSDDGGKLLKNCQLRRDRF